jgi:hypothetical protein
MTIKEANILLKKAKVKTQHWQRHEHEFVYTLALYIQKTYNLITGEVKPLLHDDGYSVVETFRITFQTNDGTYFILKQRGGTWVLYELSKNERLFCHKDLSPNHLKEYNEFDVLKELNLEGKH